MDKSGEMKKLILVKKIPLIQYQGDGKALLNSDFSLL